MLGIATHQLRTDELLARFEAPGEVERLDAYRDADCVVGLCFEDRHPVAAPRQRTEPDPTRGFSGVAARSHREPRMRLVAACAAPKMVVLYTLLDARRTGQARRLQLVDANEVEIAECGP